MNFALELGALLAHPDTGDLRVVAGPTAVTWTGVEVTLSAQDLPADIVERLAVLTSIPPDKPWQHDALIRRIRDRGYTGLALPRAESFGDGTRRLAGRLGLTLLHADSPARLAKACWQLIEGREALTLNYVRKVAQSIEYRAEAMADLLRHISSSVGHGIALIDPEGVLVEAGGHLKVDVHAAINFSPWVDVVRTAAGGAASVRVESPTRTGLRVAFFGEALDERQLAALAVAAEVTMPMIAARILLDEVAEVNDAAVSSRVLRDFMDLGGTHDPDVETRMLERGWRTGGYHIAFRLLGRTRIDSIQLLRLVKGELARVAADSHATTSGRGVSGWLSLSEPPSRAEAETYISSLRHIHTVARQLFNVAMGVGSTANGSSGLGRSLKEATDAAKIALNRSTTGWFVRVDNLGLEQLLLAWAGNDTFIPAARSLLAPIVSGRGDLLTTLAAYLDHQSAVLPTAAALGLHRNTVASRVQKAQDLLGLDMSDPEVRLGLQLAVRAIRAD